MKDYKEEDFLLLSGIQHYLFCPRQWALIYIEQQWEENYLTASGRLLHERAHNPFDTEKRKQTIVSRAMPVFSHTLGVSGECDVVEYMADPCGIPIHGRSGTYCIYPVEYKRGKPKKSEEDISQLVAQAMCLEDMFCTEIQTGFLYYYGIKRRIAVDITEERKEAVRNTFEKMHRLFERGYTPKGKPSAKCTSCSLKEICLPVLCKKKSAASYMKQIMREGEES